MAVESVTASGEAPVVSRGVVTGKAGVICETLSGDSGCGRQLLKSEIRRLEV
jgi:hypothetical protein